MNQQQFGARRWSCSVLYNSIQRLECKAGSNIRKMARDGQKKSTDVHTLYYLWGISLLPVSWTYWKDNVFDDLGDESMLSFSGNLRTKNIIRTKDSWRRRMNMYEPVFHAFRKLILLLLGVLFFLLLKNEKILAIECEKSPTKETDLPVLLILRRRWKWSFSTTDGWLNFWQFQIKIS